jgi:glycosyltransferase involved in cell wall biosynthesis
MNKAADGPGRLLLYAPNVHTGGGLVLLKALVEAWPNDLAFIAWLDARARAELIPRVGSQVFWVNATVGSRLGAEVSLAWTGNSCDTILCFNGLPPIFKQRSNVEVFQQNRNYLGEVDLTTFSWRTRQRLRYEQALSRIFRHRVQRYWVQTPSMARTLRRWYGTKKVDVRVLPFAVECLRSELRPRVGTDFVYVADGEAHKNHLTLLEAWKLLAEQGFHPSLVLTLAPRDVRLHKEIEVASRTHGLRISNVGQLPHADVLELYSNARALVFPSLGESFGLPLVEANRAGLPILASELDFVRDVCDPVETFDPKSAVSISRAVRRFLNARESPMKPASPGDFLAAVLSRVK